MLVSIDDSGKKQPKSRVPQLLMTVTHTTSQRIDKNALVAGFQSMSVEKYFKQQGYSLKHPAKRQTLDASLMAAQQLHAKTPSSNNKVSHEFARCSSILLFLTMCMCSLMVWQHGSSQNEDLLYSADRSYAENSNAGMTVHDPIS